MENLPLYIPLVMGLSTFYCVYFLAKAAPAYSVSILLVAFSWLILHSFLSVNGFYTHTQATPPRFLLAVLPPLLLILLVFATKKGRSLIDQLDMKSLILLHVARIPVEMVLFWLFLYKQVPVIITFEGQNFDVFSGITALVVYYLAYVKQRIGTGILLMWNFICLILLINVVSTAVLSAPFSFQQFGFEQPNVAVLHFPFVWLPACVVPIVLFSHLAMIRRLMNE
ncbi:hypothetical protein [Emticicia fluvialis]|uniref:hypothetical protein n=1 Tax=Emticicia fluvialis TaxID=2974474 RepID=UPI0021650E78|nr:hypothetical protein [Emticicia fluvialis]